jgi:hypothetical protein
MMLLSINLLGYTKIPYLSIIAVIMNTVLIVPTLQAFGDDYMIALLPILVNTVIPILGLSEARKR